MTFEFAPGWRDGVSGAADHALSTPKTALPPSPAIPAPCAPASPSMAQVAELVEELFAEGTLSYDQLRSLSGVPELSLLLEDALDGVPARRRSPRQQK